MFFKISTLKNTFTVSIITHYYRLLQSSKVTFQRLRFDGSKCSFSIVESILLTDSIFFNESIISLRFMHLTRCTGNRVT